MGAYLTKPITDKEDAHVATLGLGEVPTSAFFGVYDGHGGAQVARFCSLTMPNELLKNGAYQSGDVGPALKQTFLEIDNLLKRRDNMEVLEKLKADGGEEAGLGQLPVSLQKLLQNQMQKEDTNDGP